MFEGAIGQFALGEFTLSGVIPPIPPSPVVINAGAKILVKRFEPNDDDEVIIIVSQHLAHQLWKEDKNN